MVRANELPLHYAPEILDVVRVNPVPRAELPYRVIDRNVDVFLLRLFVEYAVAAEVVARYRRPFLAHFVEDVHQLPTSQSLPFLVRQSDPSVDPIRAPFLYADHRRFIGSASALRFFFRD